MKPYLANGRTLSSLGDSVRSETPIGANTREAIVVALDDLALRLTSAPGARAREAFAIREGEDLRVRETRDLVAQPEAHIDRALRERIVIEHFGLLSMLYAEEERLSERHRHADDALLLRLIVMDALVRCRSLSQAAAAAQLVGDDPEGKAVDALTRHYRRRRTKTGLQMTADGPVIQTGDGPFVDEILAAIRAGREPLKPDTRRG